MKLQPPAGPGGPIQIESKYIRKINTILAGLPGSPMAPRGPLLPRLPFGPTGLYVTYIYNHIYKLHKCINTQKICMQ